MALLLVGGPIAPSSAVAAEPGVVPGSFAVQLLDADGEPESRAGAHPDRVLVDFTIEAGDSGAFTKDLAIDLPPGFGGDPAAVPACPRQAHDEGEECPANSQVGVVSFGSDGEPLPIYMLEPEAGQVAAFTSKTGLPIPFELQLRHDDFGITFAAEGLSQGAPAEAHMELWGIPANHQEAPAAEPRPFLSLPSACGFLSFTVRTRSSTEGAQWLGETIDVGPLSGCESLAFAPRLDLQPGTMLADSPTAVRMLLSMPEEEGGELASAQMRDVTVELPPGLTVSPGGAASLAPCTDAQFGLDDEADAACPAAARAGTVELTSSVLSEPLTGAVYVGERRGDERFRLFIVADGPGMVLKIVTGLRPDPATGLLTATIHDLPQVAIGRIALTLAGGPRGLLAAPLACGPARGQARFVPYGGGPPVTSTAPVTIASALPGLACPGPLPFAPQLLLSATSNRAGKPTSFSTTLHRRGGEGLPARFDLTLPAGLSAALGAVEACPESLASSGACPPASRVGSARAEVGSGPVPAVLSGGVYVAGPYRRAPFSLVMAFGVKVGPFDLGTVAFRAMARIDGRTGRVTVATDRLPSVVEGVPIRFQTIAIALDRQGLVRNPTSCGPHSLDVALESHEGAIAASSTPYQVRGCKRLGFSPRLDAALLNRGQLRKHKQVGMRVSARFHPADTALRSLSLAMPPALKLHVDGLKEICSRPDARRGLCPLGSRIGTARARTPLLDESLAGSVYVVQPGDAGEPDIWVALAGGGIKLTVRGSTAPDHGRLLTKLSGLPDMPLSAFTMRLGGPGKNVLSFEASPCANGRPRRLGTELHVVGQNGARRLSTLLIATRSRCGAAPSR